MQILLTFLYRSLFILAAHYLLRGELEKLLVPRQPGPFPQ